MITITQIIRIYVYLNSISSVYLWIDTNPEHSLLYNNQEQHMKRTKRDKNDNGLPIDYLPVKKVRTLFWIQNVMNSYKIHMNSGWNNIEFMNS